MKSGEKYSQLAKNQILATANLIPSTTRSPREICNIFPHIFHFMTPPFCTSFAHNSNRPRSRPRPRYSRVAPTAPALAAFGRPGNLRQHPGVRRSSAAFSSHKLTFFILPSAFCLLPSAFCLLTFVRSSPLLHFFGPTPLSASRPTPNAPRQTTLAQIPLPSNLSVPHSCQFVKFASPSRLRVLTVNPKSEIRNRTPRRRHRSRLRLPAPRKDARERQPQRTQG